MVNKKMAFILLIVIAALVISIIPVLFFCRYEIMTKYRNKVYAAASVPAVNVCMILGANVWGKEPSFILEDRLLAGIGLYHQGKVKKLLLTGDHGTGSHDEVNVMKKFTLSRGVSEHDIFMDHAGFRTYDSCYRARDVFGVAECIIITNKFHLPRALYIANELGIDAVGVPSDLRPYLDMEWNNLREFFAQFKAFLDIRIFKPKPRFLGPKIDINGSGVVTQD